MSNELSSIVVGTSGLTLAAIVALLLATSRQRIGVADRPSIRRLAIFGVLLQTGHFTEETLTQFYVRFPELLGLAPWSETFFVSFNLVWVSVWVLSIALLKTYPRAAAFPIWFLGIASAANGVIHPALALASTGYFPGLWSSPLVGILGVVLLRKLASATSGQGASVGPPEG
jgi:hypothetical protein